MDSKSAEDCPSSWPADILPLGVQIQGIQTRHGRFEVAVSGPEDAAKFALALHGFPELHLSWSHQIQTLAQRGYRVWAPCLRGYGHSPKPQGWQNYQIDNLLDDVCNLIDASGARETLLLGHDWGGFLAWMFCMRKLRTVSQLIICNMPHPRCFIRELCGVSQIIKSYYILLFQVGFFGLAE